MSDDCSDPGDRADSSSPTAGRIQPTGGTAVHAPTGPSAAPSSWVVRWLGRLGPGDRRVLDFACGTGRHARFAARAGFRVLAVDRDAAALACSSDTKHIECRQEDLECGRWSFGAERFHAVVATNYLFRPRLDLLCGLLAPGGMLIVETFAVGNARYGRPSNPEFLLRRGELPGVVDRAGLFLLGYEDGYVGSPRPARVQRAAAIRPPFDPERLPLDAGPAAAVGGTELR